MSKHILLTVITSFGLLLGCEKNNATDTGQQVGEPGDESSVRGDQPPREPAPAVQQPATQPEVTPGTPDETAQRDMDVLPAVSIISIGVDCLPADVYFPTGSAELGADDKADLDSLASCLKGTAKKEDVRITATSDPRGPERYNQELSQRRAQAVADYLQQQGVSEGSFQIRARGEKGVVEGMPTLWPLQRGATVQPMPPGSADQPGSGVGGAAENQRNDRPQGGTQ